MTEDWFLHKLYPLPTPSQNMGHHCTTRCFLTKTHMKRYSITTPSSRRKSMRLGDGDDEQSIECLLKEEERLDQEISLVLQDIDRNLSNANSIVMNKIIPNINGYRDQCERIWKNAGFWKVFFERSAGVVLDPVAPQDLHPIQHHDDAFVRPTRIVPVRPPDSAQDDTPDWPRHPQNPDLDASTPQSASQQGPSTFRATNERSRSSQQAPPIDSIVSASDFAANSSQQGPGRYVPSLQNLNTANDILSPERGSQSPSVDSSPSLPERPVMQHDLHARNDSSEDSIGNNSSRPRAPRLHLDPGNLNSDSELDRTLYPFKAMSPVELPPDLSPSRTYLEQKQRPQDSVPTAGTDSSVDAVMRPVLLLRPPASAGADRLLLLEDLEIGFNTANERDNVFLQNASRLSRIPLEPNITATLENPRLQGSPSRGDVPQGPVATGEGAGAGPSSMSHIFESASFTAQQDADNGNVPPARDLFKDMHELLQNSTNTDGTGDSTNELAPQFREMFKKLTSASKSNGPG